LDSLDGLLSDSPWAAAVSVTLAEINGFSCKRPRGGAGLSIAADGEALEDEARLALPGMLGIAEMFGVAGKGLLLAIGLIPHIDGGGAVWLFSCARI